MCICWVHQRKRTCVKLVANLPEEGISCSVFTSITLALPVRWEQVDIIWKGMFYLGS